MSDEDRERPIEEILEKMEEALEVGREQIAFTIRLQQKVDEIHSRIMSGRFPLVPREPHEGDSR